MKILFLKAILFILQRFKNNLKNIKFTMKIRTVEKKNQIFKYF